MEDKIIECKLGNCEYNYVSYSEWDTGYKEYGCELTNSDCNEYECPLVCRYKVEE